ncbi:MAG: FmdB family zinc ribbon protein [bacterium]
MPIYEFRCRNCGEMTEILCKMGENGKDLVCPACGGRQMQRQLSCFNSASLPGGKSCPPGCGGNCGNCR